MKTLLENKMQAFPPLQEDIVKLENWFTTPEKIRSLFCEGEIQPTRNIWRGGSSPTPLPYAANQMDLKALSVSVGEGEVESAFDLLTKTKTDAFLVLHKGEIVYEEYFNGFKPYQLHAMNSITKSFVSLIVCLLADQGIVDLEGKASIYIPELHGTGLGEGTVQQLLDMQVPVNYTYTSMPKTGTVTIGRGTPYFIASGSLPKPDQYDGPENLYEFMLSSQADKTPGTQFFYENGQTETLAWIVKRFTGKNMAELIQEHIWSKLGAEENATMTIDPIGTDIAGSGMSATLRDLARFGEMMRNEGYYNGQQIIPTHIIREAQKECNKEYVAASDFGSLPGYSYHNQWWQSNDQFGGYQANGRFDQRIYITPDAETVIVKLSSNVQEKYIDKTFVAIVEHLVRR